MFEYLKRDPIKKCWVTIQSHTHQTRPIFYDLSSEKVGLNQNTTVKMVGDACKTRFYVYGLENWEYSIVNPAKLPRVDDTYTYMLHVYIYIYIYRIV